MTSSTSENKLHFGIDVSKNTLDVHCHESGDSWQIKNRSSAIRRFATRHHLDLNNTFVVVDMAGGYELDICNLLVRRNITVHHAQPFRVKSFIRACGQLARSDAIDAMMLAQYGRERENNLQPYQPHDRQTLKLKALVERRNDLVQIQTSEKNRRVANGL